MSSSTRIQRLRHYRDFIEATDGASGLQILTNVSFDGNATEAIRLDLASPNSSLRSSTQRIQFPRSKIPFEVHNPAIMLSSDQLAGLQDNFAVVHEALGDNPLGKISIENSVHESILPMIQAKSYEIDWIDSLLGSLSLDSALYRSYLNHPNAVAVSDQGVAATLLADFRQASELYSQLPELRAYLVQGDVRTKNIGPRGQQFRSWLQESKTISNESGLALDYVAYELRPLRISGSNFQWKQNIVDDSSPTQGVSWDLRRVSVDLLLRFEGCPLWTEVKMQGDTWTSSAMQQILFYGSMLSSGNQKRRCRRHFSDQFQSFQPWLGILVEDQDDSKCLADYEQTVKFASSQSLKSSLEDSFGGIVFGMIQEAPNGWTLSKSKIIRWN
jgi:hypothetical protein